MQKDHIKEMQHARNEGGIDTKVNHTSSWAYLMNSRPPFCRVLHLPT